MKIILKIQLMVLLITIKIKDSSLQPLNYKPKALFQIISKIQIDIAKKKRKMTEMDYYLILI